jgi:CheY-like chemotaxis protein
VVKQLWRPAVTTEPMMSPSCLEQGALVVVVDDELSVREAMEMMLETWGLRTSSHPDAASALLALADEPNIPLLLVCDYRLAGATNGIQVIEKIRSEYNVDSELPALLMTGDTGTADLQVAKNSGIKVMHKPVETDHLRAYLEQLSQERRMSAAPTETDE